MKSTNILNAIVEKKELKIQGSRSYCKPVLLRLGSIASLTAGSRGSKVDHTNPAAPTYT